MAKAQPTEENKGPLEVIEAQNADIHNNSYVPQSDSCRTVDTVVPASMRYDMHKAIETIDRRVNGVDEYVAEKLGYILGNCTLDQRKEGLKCLCDAFSAEQVDAIAVLIYNIEEKKQGCIIGDQTGIGKGRIAAGMLRYAVHRGLQPIFLTEKPNLFSDIFRDIINIGSDDDIPEEIFRGYKEVDRKSTQSESDGEGEEVGEDGDDNEDVELVKIRIPVYEKNKAYPKFTKEILDKQGNATGEYKTITGKNFFKPFIVNGRSGKTAIKDEQGHILYQGDSRLVEQIIGASKKSGENVTGTGVVPPEFKFILATYSQFRGASTTPKMQFLQRIAAGNIVVMDESHNASGASNVGAYLRKVLEETAGVCFLSATFAKRPDNMPIYASKTCMMDANMTAEQLVDAVERGGVALQEIVSANLVSEGQMIRRERSFEGIEVNYEYLDDTQEARGYPNLNKEQEHRAIMDRATDIIRDVMMFQEAYVNPIIDQMDRLAAAENKQAEGRKGTAKGGIDNPPIFSGIFNMVSQLLFSVKAEAVAEVAIQRMKEGKKTVIAFANTMESFLDTLTNDDGSSVGDGDIVSSDFSKILEKRLKGSLRYTVKDDKGNPEYKSLDVEEQDDDFQLEYKRILGKIKKSSVGISSSPIDVLIDKIQKAGFSVVEVTGRGRQFKMMPGGKAMIKNRLKISANDAFRQFNNNEADCILINQSGSTGASAHAIPLPPKVPADKVKQRVMIILQAELNINTEVQKRGRINRTGQIIKPIYDYVISAIPAEKRLMMMLQKKLKSLDANTTSNQKQSRKVMDERQSDFLNKYGDQLVVDYLKEHPLVNKMIGDPLKLQDLKEDEKPDTDNAAHRVSGRIAILSVKDQENFYREMTERYASLVEYLLQTGEYDLEVENMNLEAHTIDKQVVVAGKGGESVFGRNSILEKCDVNNLRKPFTKKELDALIKESLAGGYTPDKLKASIIAKFERFVAAKLAEDLQNEDEHWSNVAAEVNNEKKIRDIKDERARNQAIRERLEQIEAAKTESKYKIERQTENKRQGIAKYFNFFTVGKVVGYPSVNYEQDHSWTKAVFLGFDIKETAKNPYAPSALRLRFAVASSQKYIAVPASKWQVIDSITALTYQNIWEEEQQSTIDNWDELVKEKTADRAIRFIVTGNILQAYSEEMLKGALISYTTSTGGVKKGILLPEGFSLQAKGDKKEFRITVPIIKALPIIKGMQIGRGITTTDQFTIIRRSEDYLISCPINKQKFGKFYLNATIIALTTEKNFNKVADKMAGHLELKKITNLVEFLQNEFGCSVKLIQSEFEKIKDTIKLEDYTDEERKPEPDVFVDKLSEEDRTEAERREKEKQQAEFEEEERRKEAEAEEKNFHEAAAKRQKALNKVLNLILLLNGKKAKYAGGGQIPPDSSPNMAEALTRAKDLGRAAFIDGKKRVPYQDPALMKLIDEHAPQVGTGAVELMKSWYKGWDRENLDNPVE